MASISSPKSLCSHSIHRNLISLNLLLSPSSLSFQLCPRHCQLRHSAAVKTGSDGRGGSDPYAAELLRKPVISPEFELSSASEDLADDDDNKEKSGGDGAAWVDWEDQILEDTVYIHVSKYKGLIWKMRYALN